MKRTSVVLDKPIYTGFTVLELSKLHMYDFHYNHIMEKYGPEKVTLQFTDTDSLTYEIRTEDLCKDMDNDLDLFDTTNYPREHRLYSPVNNKKIGKFKDGTGSLPIVEWVGLRPKMYSMRTDDGKEKKTGKGIKKSVLKKDIKPETVYLSDRNTSMRWWVFGVNGMNCSPSNRQKSRRVRLMINGTFSMMGVPQELKGIGEMG